MLLLAILSGRVLAQQQLDWVKPAGGADVDSANAIAVDGSGSSYVTGSYQGTATFGSGEPNQTSLPSISSEIFIAKYASNGSLLWAKRAGGTGDQIATAIALDNSSNVYITGYYLGGATFGIGEPNETVLASDGFVDFFVAKFNSTGSLIWAKRALGTINQGLDIAVDSSGNSYVTGVFGQSSGTATFGPGEANETVLTSTNATRGGAFLAKFDSTGTLVWAKKADLISPETQQSVLFA